MFVTVLLSALNAEATISEAIASILSQTHKDFELILIDDGSTDRTLMIMQRFGLNDPRVRVVSHPNMGMGASLNAGLSMARAHWVARMDADDVMIPDRLERQLSFVRDNCGVTVASSLVYHIDDDGRLLGSSVSDLKTAADLARYVRNNETIGFHHPAVIMRRDVVLEIGGYRPQFWPADDIDLWTRIAEKGHLLLVQQEYLLKYRIHSRSVSIANAVFARRQLRWVKQCAASRRQGIPEPSHQEFLHIEANHPLWRRWNRRKKEAAKVCYKTAVQRYASRRYMSAALPFVNACLLQPSYSLRQLYGKLLCFKLRRWRDRVTSWAVADES